MSTVGRSTSRGGKGSKQDSANSKSQKSDSKTDSPKAFDHNPKAQPTAEQMRIAQIIETKPEDPGLKEKIRQLMDATTRTEDEVVTALHDCDNDIEKAITWLLEGKPTDWKIKKKKNRQPNAAKTETVVNNRDAEQEDWGQDREPNQDRERSRIRGNGPPRMRGGRNSLDTKRWRGRENKENEKNLEDGREGYHRGGGGGRMMNGPGRSGRGGRGGRQGPRTFQNRDKGGIGRSIAIDTWNSPGSEDNAGGDPMKTEKWPDFSTHFPPAEDWDNEEYTGSLADSKVFTPSGGTIEAVPNSEPLINSQEQPATEISSALTAPNLSNTVASSSTQMPQNVDLHRPSSQLSQSPVPVGNSQLAQSEFLNQLTQGTECLKSAVGVGTNTSSSASFGTTSTSYPVTSIGYQSQIPPITSPFSTNYVSSNSSFSNQIQEQPLDSTSTTQTQPIPARTKTQRPRVPPPSKIPATAVEMPGDAINSSIGYLDVQFGGLEFGSETSSFETTTEQSKYSSNVSNSVLDSLPSPRTTTNLDLGSSQTSALDAYTGSTTQQKGNQTSIANALSQGPKHPGSDTMLSSAEHKVSQSSFTQTRSSASSGLDMEKNEVGLPYSTPSTAPYQSSYQSQKSSGPAYQTPSSYSSSNYSSAQITSSTTGYTNNQTQMSYTSSGTGSGYSGQTAAPSSYPNSSSSYSQTSTGVTYQASYPPMTQPGSFPNQQYQPVAQSVYGGSALGSTGYTASAVTQYQNSYGSSTATTVQNHTKLTSSLNSATKEAQYDSTTTTSSNLSSTNSTTTNSGLPTNVNAAPALGLASSNQTVNTTSTKVTSSTVGKSNVVPNIPPGVPPMLGTPQYIMSQTGLPYFQQPVYSFEDIQLLQQRIPHMPTGYYDMGFQAPTSLATGREGGLASVAYSMSDGRYTRADNNASPVPSTLSQQSATQAHQQPMINPTGLPPGYAYFYGGGMMPGSFQYGTPAIYPMPPATNAHGSTTSSQYPKPGNYGSGYGSGYDGIAQNQEYGKTGYVSGSQSQSKAGVGASGGTSGSSASDLSATMYGKSHVALTKVNSFEKQAFHSATPPPFNLPGSQSNPMAHSAGYAPHLFIPAMPTHQQHHSTTLMHQPLPQMELRNPGRRPETGSSSNQRSQPSVQPNKSGAKQGYTPSYWTPN